MTVSTRNAVFLPILVELAVNATISWVISAVGTTIDPALCRADKMVGQVLGSVASLPDVYRGLTIYYYLMRRLLGVRKPKPGKKRPRVRVENL